MTLAVGVCRVTLRLPENQSLKGKRQVLKSLIARLHNRFNVSVAEVDHQDSWQIASIAISCVANDERHADQVMASAIAFIRDERLDAEVLDVETEIVRGLD
ncbi:MAG TPA: DUF503 domain-containing protein [Dehalococcoidia bacterium]|jgi:uncharacterized protein YlxP (DUF503 family)|nr:DUF503 domain-containing protein [Dehalococcoidia bacterium]